MSLHPPLGVIEASLFQPSSDVSNAAPNADLNMTREGSQAEPDVDERSVAEDPGWSEAQLETLLTLAKRTQAEADDLAPLAPGQIRLLKSSAEQQQAFYMLVRQPGLLYVDGWLVAAEVDYASDTDWVFQEDEVIHPLSLNTAMVLLWNPLQLPINAIGGMVNALQPVAWKALRSVEATLLEPDRGLISDPNAQFSGTCLAGVEFVTGAPLVPGARYLEERLEYQSLYKRWTEELVLASVSLMRAGQGKASPTVLEAVTDHEGLARLELETQSLSAEQYLRHRLDGADGAPREKSSAGWWKTLALASLAALVTTLVVLPQWQDPADEGVRGAIGTNSKDAAKVLMEVHVSPTATLGEVSDLLGRAGGQIVGGPGPSGAFTVSIAPERAAEALASLRASPLVERAEIKQTN